MPLKLPLSRDHPDLARVRDEFEEGSIPPPSKKQKADDGIALLFKTMNRLPNSENDAEEEDEDDTLHPLENSAKLPPLDLDGREGGKDGEEGEEVEYKWETCPVVGKSSVWWAGFQQFKPKDDRHRLLIADKKVMCKECLDAGEPRQGTVKLGSSGSTSALKSHKRVYHKEEFYKIDEAGTKKAPKSSKWDTCPVVGKSSAWWAGFRQFKPKDDRHRQLIAENKVMCKECLDAGEPSRGTVKLGSTGSTSALKSHKRVYHKQEFYKIDDAEKKKNPKLSGSGSASIGRMRRISTAKTNPEDTKLLYKVATATLVIEEAIPFQTMTSKAWRRMTGVLNVQADNICDISRHTIRDSVIEMGGFTEEAVKKEMVGKQVSWTSEHWKGPNNETYSTVTAHYIDPAIWKMISTCLDFKVFEKSPDGEAIYSDIVSVLQKFHSDDYQDTIVFDTIGITDTTGTMGSLGQYLRDGDKEHGYCTDHVLHLVSKLAFDPKEMPEVAQTLKNARNIATFFNNSTQAMADLKKQQEDCSAPEYSGTPKKCLIDVVTRWWSTYRMLKRLIFLRKAITHLIIDGVVTGINNPTDDEWEILKLVEKTLSTMAYWQRVLEGGNHVTGSLVPLAIFTIRRKFTKTLDSIDCDDRVKRITKVLRDEFDKRYHLGQGGKLKYTSHAETGNGKHHTGIHHYYFKAAFLDPRVNPILPKMMTEDGYTQLKEDVLDRMVEEYRKQHPSPQQTDAAPPHTLAQTSAVGAPDELDDILGDLVALPAPSEGSGPESPDSIHEKCYQELNLLLLHGDFRVPLRDINKNYTCPLTYWNLKADQFKICAALARVFLAIPATSASSERVWSRAARVLTAKRNRMEDDITQTMMYVRENHRILHKHYEEIARSLMAKNDHCLIGQQKALLPTFDRDDDDEFDESKIDVGGDEVET